MLKLDDVLAACLEVLFVLDESVKSRLRKNCNELEVFSLLQQSFVFHSDLPKFCYPVSIRLSCVAFVMHNLPQKPSSSGLVL
mgnify:CR=1 FL=1